MAKDSSFDVVSEVNMQEVDNASSKPRARFPSAMT